MWLLEHTGATFQGRRLWLRPGKRYLFGRTRAETGQLVVSDKTISRKHLTITVEKVAHGDGRNRHGRSVVTVEDLHTKVGTVVNGTQIRGQKFVLISDTNEIKMGNLATLFRITWFPVVLSFSFTSKELRADPWSRLDDELEQLDVCYLAEYDRDLTTHVVAKKRNTSKGLQALINGKYIVTEDFIRAMVTAAAAAAAPAHTHETAPAPLETDFDAYWPNALDYLPPRGDEPSDRPVATYGPDARRRGLFDGYTFIFYDQKQYETLLAPIVNGQGQALLADVVPGQTEVDTFVSYVKGVAGEAGLGPLEDGGSESRGVVVVRYLPAKGEHVDWFARFSTAVSLRLDHRLIDQREFLDAILAVEPSMLRRRLEEEAPVAQGAKGKEQETDALDRDERVMPSQASTSQQPTAAARARSRRGLTSRFKGFDVDLDLTSDPLAEANPGLDGVEVGAPEEAMFVSQSQEQAGADTRPAQSQKRSAAAMAEEAEDIMAGIAPTAAAVKRQRIEAGEEPVPALASAADEDDDDEDGKQKKKGKAAAGKGKAKVKVEDLDVLALARRNREAAEKRAAEERRQLAEIPDDGIDAAEIRKLTLVEQIAVREAPAATSTSAPRTREQNSANGRWDPSWNGRRNFKKFRKQGDAVGRPVKRVILGLEPAKTKEYGIGDDYWLGGGSGSGPQKLFPASPSPRKATATSSPASPAGASHLLDASLVPDSDGEGGGGLPQEMTLASDSEPEPVPDLPRTRAAKAAARTRTRRGGSAAAEAEASSSVRSSATLASTGGARGKRPAAVEATTAKRPRRGAAAAAAPITINDSDSDDDDGLRFRFRR